MLTDLDVPGYLEDKGGKPCQSRVACPGDRVLRAAFERIGVTGAKDWAELIADPPDWMTTSVRHRPAHFICPSKPRDVAIAR